MRVEICPEVEVEGSVDVLVAIGMQCSWCRLGLAEGFEGSIVEIVRQDVGYLSVYDLWGHDFGLNYNLVGDVAVNIDDW